MHVRHLAWLHAIPEGSKKPRLASYKGADEDSSFLKLPELDGADYLVGLLNEAGLAASNGMGATPLSWQEIESWIKCTALDLSVWEKLTVKMMSEAYVSELNQASAKDRPPPYVAVVETEAEALQSNRDSVADKLRKALTSMQRKSNSKTPKARTKK